MSRHLMAKFRRTAFDWKGNHGSPDNMWAGKEGTPHYRIDSYARLENGHRLHVWGYPHGRDGQEWLAGYHDGSDNEWGGFNAVTPEGYEANAYLLNEPQGKKVMRWFDTEHEARAAAEKAYMARYPIGSDTGRHDSGVDYSDLNKFMDEL